MINQIRFQKRRIGLLLLAIYGLYLCGCSTTRTLPLDEFAVKEKKSPGKPLLLRYEDRAWILDSVTVLPEGVRGVVHEIPRPASSRDHSYNAYKNEYPLGYGQVTLYLENKNYTEYDSTSGHLEIPISSIDSVSTYEFSTGKTLTLAAGTLIGISVIVAVSYLIALSNALSNLNNDPG